MKPQTSPEAPVLGLPFTHTSLPGMGDGLDV